MNFILLGLWRTAPGPREIGADSGHPRKIAEGRLIYISFLSAMLDARRVPNPKHFDPSRPDDVYMIYGHQFHYCVGAQISDAMMKEIFMALMKRNPRARGKMKLLGNFPWNLIVEYDT